jgi:hypothetical protein
VGDRRNPKCVVTVLIKEFFRSLVTYVAAPDTPNQDGVEYDNCLERVEETFWLCFFIYINPLAYSRKVH